MRVSTDQGEVIGIVSTSFEGANRSVAHIFSGWNVPELNFPTLDPDNPGWFRGLAAIDGTGTLRFFGHDPEEVEQFASSNGCKSKVVSLNPANGDWMASEVAFPHPLKPPSQA